MIEEHVTAQFFVGMDFLHETLKHIRCVEVMSEQTHQVFAESPSRLCKKHFQLNDEQP